MHKITKSSFICAFLQPMLCPLPQTALTSLSVSPSCALPGDALNSVVDSTKEPSSTSVSKIYKYILFYITVLIYFVVQRLVSHNIFIAEEPHIKGT